MTLHQFPKVDQGTDEWHALRRGIVTASVVGKLLTVGAPGAIRYGCPECGASSDEACMSLRGGAPIKTMHSARSTLAETHAATAPPVIEVANNDTSRGLIATLAAERIADFTEDTPMTSDMWRGVEAEPIARDAYSEYHTPVTEIGFMVEDRWGFQIGYSPDGLVGDDGLIEVKAPRAKTHVAAVIADEVPAHNMAQLQCGLLVSGRKWVDFIPFVAGLPLWTKRVYPDPAWHEAIVAAVANFETTAAEMVAAYTRATTDLPATERASLEIVI